MNDDEINEKYNQLLNKHGPSFKSLGWSKDLSRARFFSVLKSLNLEKGDRLLDFGCGFGDLFSFLRARGDLVDYVGFDINSNLLNVARQRYPDASFVNSDILNDELTFEGDFVVSCGVHNIKRSDNYDFLDRSISKFLQIAKKGISINLLSDRVDYFTKESFHFNPSRVLEIAYGYGNRVLLDNSVMPFEFTLTILKDQSFDENYPCYK